MLCPHCKKELRVLDRCYLNAETYHQTVYARTECCLNMVIIIPKMTFGIMPYKGDRREDDWGLELKK